jgi:ribonuclease HII
MTPPAEAAAASAGGVMRRSSRAAALAAGHLAAGGAELAEAATASAGGAAVASASNAGAATKTLPLAYERRVWTKWTTSTLVAGVDEAGRGPLCGPVVAAAVAILDPARHEPLAGVNDSKTISDEAERERLFASLTSDSTLAFGVASLEHTEIDRINILNAAMAAMTRAVADLRGKLPAARAVDFVFIDGNRVPAGIEEEVRSGAIARGCEAVVGGDGKVYSIAAASIIAKVTRDRIMHEHAKRWPQYGWDDNKGYGTAAHVAAIYEHGPCEIHRRSFNPVKSMLGAAAAAAAAATAAGAPRAAPVDVGIGSNACSGSGAGAMPATEASVAIARRRGRPAAATVRSAAATATATVAESTDPVAVAGSKRRRSAVTGGAR